MRTTYSMTALALVLTIPAAAHSQSHSEHTTLTPSQIEWVDLPDIPGVQIAVLQGQLDQAGPFVVRAKYPADGEVAPHFHPTTEHVTVVSGTFHVGMGDTFDRSATQAFPAGSFLVTPPKAVHFGWVEGETVLQVHGVGPWGITYVNPGEVVDTSQ